MKTVYFDATWEPTERLKVAAQLGFDAFNPEFLGIGDTGRTIPAAVVGVTYSKDMPAGSLEFYSEAGYTDYCWGNFSSRLQGNIRYDDTLARAIYRLDQLNGAGGNSAHEPLWPRGGVVLVLAELPNNGNRPQRRPRASCPSARIRKRT